MFRFHAPAHILRYILLSHPSWIIQFYLERIGRPSYAASTGELVRSGEDLEGKGLMTWMWDVVYWSWGTVALVGLFGDWAWWAWVSFPPSRAGGGKEKCGRNRMGG